MLFFVVVVVVVVVNKYGSVVFPSTREMIPVRYYLAVTESKEKSGLPPPNPPTLTTTPPPNDHLLPPNITYPLDPSQTPTHPSAHCFPYPLPSARATFCAPPLSGYLP